MSDWICRACYAGDHDRCDLWRGCECSVRRGLEPGQIVVCEALTQEQMKGKGATPYIPPPRCKDMGA